MNHQSMPLCHLQQGLIFSLNLPMGLQVISSFPLLKQDKESNYKTFFFFFSISSYILKRG